MPAAAAGASAALSSGGSGATAGFNVGQAVAGGASILDIGVGWANMLAARANTKWQRDWAKMTYLNQLQREDTEVQRRVADLRAAGLSPTLAAGGGAASSTGPQISTKPPELNIPSANDIMAANLMRAQYDKTKAEELWTLMQAKNSLQLVPAQAALMSSEAYNNSVTAQTKAHDLRIARETGLSTNPSSIAKTVRDVDSVLRKRINDASVRRPVGYRREGNMITGVEYVPVFPKETQPLRRR